jgi:hypothetical protein
MRSTRRVIAAAVIAVVASLGVTGLAHAADSYPGNEACAAEDYGTQGPNGDRSDDGCDTTRYENRGSNGDSAPDDYDYGHGTPEGDRPLGEGLFKLAP